MAVAVSLNDLAQLYYLEGRFAEAEPLYRRALAILAEIERVHPLTSAVLFNNVAELFSAQGAHTSDAVMPRLETEIAAGEPSEVEKTEQTIAEISPQPQPPPAQEVEVSPPPAQEAVVALAAEIAPPEPRVSLAPEEDTAAPAAEVAPVVPRPPEEEVAGLAAELPPLPPVAPEEDVAGLGTEVPPLASVVPAVPQETVVAPAAERTPMLPRRDVAVLAAEAPPQPPVTPEEAVITLTAEVAAPEAPAEAEVEEIITVVAAEEVVLEAREEAEAGEIIIVVAEEDEVRETPEEAAVEEIIVAVVEPEEAAVEEIIAVVEEPIEEPVEAVEEREAEMVPPDIVVGEFAEEASDLVITTAPEERVDEAVEEIDITVAAQEEIVEPEPAEIPNQNEATPEEPVGDSVVAALEPEPEPEKAASRPADLPAGEEAAETGTPSAAQSEWARIDAALDVSRGNVVPAAAPEDDAAGMFFDLAGVIIDGSSIYTASDFLPIYRRYLGQEISVTELYKISQAITARYAADGYTDTTAEVPSQMIRGGVVTIRITEDFFGNIIIVD